MYTKGGESLFITPSHIRHDCHTLIMHYYTTLYYFEKSFTQCKMEFRKLLLSSTLLSAKALISIAKQLIWGVQGVKDRKKDLLPLSGKQDRRPQYGRRTIFSHTSICHPISWLMENLVENFKGLK